MLLILLLQLLQMRLLLIEEEEVTESVQLLTWNLMVGRLEEERERDEVMYTHGPNLGYGLR